MLGNMNKTKKNKTGVKGGSNTNIFSDYNSIEIQRRLNNYLSAAYALKQTTDTIKNTVESKITNPSTATYKLQTNNSEQFALATSRFSSLIHQFNTNFLRNSPIPPYSIPPMPTVLPSVPPAPSLSPVPRAPSLSPVPRPSPSFPPSPAN